tara:strand:- start:3461 stop:4282 length:822 start_codon:yes stop_codon:yes gene_type:complete
MSINIAIVGHGYVGKAVDHGFSTSQVDKHIIDPIYNTTLNDIKGKFRLDAAFVCVPTPFGPDGSIDSSIVEDVVEQLSHFTCPIIIKSTVTPNVVERLSKNSDVVYNPEFLTEANHLEDFVNPPMHIFGGNPLVTRRVQDLYEKHSQCKPCPVTHMTAMEASFVKYGINCFLATKVLWFNQFKDLIDDTDSKYNVIVNAIGSDPRIGHSHTQVPGPDGKKGFGGACFPKDTNAFSTYARGEFSVLDDVIKANNIYRKEYELDDREKEQKVSYA